MTRNAPTAAPRGAAQPPKTPPADAAGDVITTQRPVGLMPLTHDLCATAAADLETSSDTNLEWCASEARRIAAQPGRRAMVWHRNGVCTLYVNRVAGNPGTGEAH